MEKEQHQQLWQEKQEAEREALKAKRDEVKERADKEVREDIFDVCGDKEIVNDMSTEECCENKLTCTELLNVDDFEKYIAVNTSIEDLKAIFLATDEDLNKFCRREYGLDFKTAYTLLLRRALAEYKSCLSGLACGGNATAINTINQLTLDMTNSNEVRIKVVGAVPVEDDD